MSKVLIDMGTILYSIASVRPDADDESGKSILDNKLKRLLLRLEATHFICFVDGKHNFRKKAKHDYKAHRTSTPPESLEMLKEYAKEKWKAVEGKYLEADDTLAITYEYYKKKGFKDMYIVSGDKDMQQLAGTHMKLYKSDIERIEVDENQAFRNLYNQMISGDGADNIKGIPGYGPAKFTKVSNGVFSDLIGDTDVPAIEKHRKNNNEYLQLLYLLEQYLFTLGLYKGLEQFSENFLTLYLKREPIFDFQIPKWKRYGKKK